MTENEATNKEREMEINNEADKTRKPARLSFLDDPDFTAGVMNITPEIAQEWLDNRTVNRSKTTSAAKASINNYKKDMVNGKWMLSNDAISFNHEGFLINGQHRLQAVIDAGVPVKMFVVKGVEPFTEMDRGRKRTDQQNLSMFADNLPNAFKEKQMVYMNRWILYCLGNPTPSTNSIQDFFNTFSDSLDEFLNEMTQYKSQKVKQVPVFAALWLAFHNGIDIEILANITHVIGTNGKYTFDGFEMNRFLPAQKLTNFISKMPDSTRKTKYELFLRTMFAIDCISENKFLESKNRPASEILYDLEYNGTSISEWFPKLYSSKK